MSYAVRRDETGKIIGWRAVDDIDGLLAGEEIQDELPPVVEAPPPAAVDPVDKLKRFLVANPDVAALLGV